MKIGVLRSLALLLGLSIVYSIYDFPLARIAIFTGLAVYAVLLWRFSFAWLLVLPAMLPVFDLSPWSGRIAFNEFDFFIWITFATACWNRRLSFDFIRKRSLRWLISALVVSQVISSLIGIFALQDHGEADFFIYHDDANVIRIGRGFWEALLLLPLLDYENIKKRNWGWYLSIGIIAGLSFFILSVFWERLAFPGLFDVRTGYRISGLFSGMLVGGAIIDGFLVMAFPFFVVCFNSNGGKAFYCLGVCVFLGALYCFLVTYTRSTYLAFLVIMASLFLGYKAIKYVSLKRWLNVGISGLIAIGLVMPIISGEFVQKRFSTVSADFDNRLNHWGKALQLMDGSVFNYLFGMGVGSFPKYYAKEFDPMGGFSLKNDGLSYLRLSKSNVDGSLYVRQRFTMDRSGEYRVAVKARTFGPTTERLLIELCERNILPFLRECPTVELAIEPTNGKWNDYSKTINISYKTTLISRLRTTEVSIMNRGLKQPIDIAEIRFLSSENEQFLRNNDFSDGFDFWMFSSGNHLAWHVKNQALSIFFESGFLGLSVFVVLVLSLLRQSYGMVLTNNSYGVVFLACLLGLGVVGFFDSPLDDPRNSWLFYLLAASIAIGPKYEKGSTLFLAPWKRLFSIVALLFAVLFLGATAYWLRTHGVGGRELYNKGLKELSGRFPTLDRWLKPQPKFTDVLFDGQVREHHPRVVLPELGSWNGNGASAFIVDRLRQYSEKKIGFLSACNSSDMLALVSCRLTSTGFDFEVLRKKINEFSINNQNETEQVSNAWQLALAYDLSYSVLTPEERKSVEEKIVRALRMTLDILDENAMSMWHRRASHAAVAWLCAIVLDGENVQDLQLLRTRAQGHFLNAIDALAFTEVWPEGYNYWINDRGFLYALAASAYVNGLDNAQQSERIKQVMRQVGYWHIYATRPDNRIEGFGDEGPRVDLKDETRRVIDLIAQMTKDPVLAGYSAYLAKLYGAESYYVDYRWGFLLFNDPSLVIAGNGSLESLSPYLFKAKLFGANSVNYAYMRSDWTREATFITYKAGHNFSHHGHYDAGHFTLFKGAPLIVNSSTYGDLFSSNRLNYSIRTVAKNSLLIQRPDEKVMPNYLFKENVSDGGQRLAMPTGSAVLSVKDWYQNYHAGNHYEAAELLSYADSESFSAISSDLTPAYNNSEFEAGGDGGKVSSVFRDLLYLKNEDRLIIFDRIKSTNINYTPKFLFHTVQKPVLGELKVLKGSVDDGILESKSDVIKVNNGLGYLVANGLYPEEGMIHLIGGKNYKYYVESDGDDNTLNGKNYEQGAQEKPWFDNAQWRIEMLSKTPSLENEFLVVFSPSVGGYRQVALQRLEVNAGNAKGLETDEYVVAFSKSENTRGVGFEVHGNKNKILLIGFDVNKDVSVNGEGKNYSCSSFRFEKAVEITCQDSIHGNINIKFN